MCNCAPGNFSTVSVSRQSLVASWRAALLMLIISYSGGCYPTQLVGSGTIVWWPPAVSATPARISLSGLYAHRQDVSTPPSEDDSRDGERVLQAVFSGARDPQLVDIVVYYPNIHKPPLVFLMQGGKMRRVLDRESQAWVVLLVDETKDKTCPKVGVSLEGVGYAVLEAGLSPEALFGAMLLRKDQDGTALVPAARVTSTESKNVGELGEMCVAIERFELKANSLNRLSVEPEKEASAREVQQIELVNGNGDPLCPASVCSKPRVPPSTDKQPGSGPWTQSFFNFANTRIPPHFGGVAIGFHPADLTHGFSRWCTQAGYCVPSLYAFGYLYSWQLGLEGGAEWSTPAVAVISPVLGIRLLDPAFGDVVGGLRVGAGDRLRPRTLSRFGIIAGVSYVFTGQTATGPEYPEARSTLGRWRLFTGVDFAF